MLARVNEKDADKRTNAELIANAALVAALGGDVSAMREIRSATEGEKTTNFNIDFSKLSDEQLERIAGGEDIRVVISTASESGDGETPAGTSDADTRGDVAAAPEKPAAADSIRE